MSLELSKEQRRDALVSMQQYFERNLPEPLGDLAAGLLLDFILEEIGPLIYNQAIADAQTRLGQRVTELDGELYEAPFLYWTRAARQAKGRSR